MDHSRADSILEPPSYGRCPGYGRTPPWRNKRVLHDHRNGNARRDRLASAQTQTYMLVPAQMGRHQINKSQVHCVYIPITTCIRTFTCDVSTRDVMHMYLVYFYQSTKFGVQSCRVELTKFMWSLL